MNQYKDKELETPQEVMDVWMENYALNHLIHTKIYMIGLKKQKRGYGKQCKKKYFNNIYWITLCIIYDLFQNVMNNIK